MRFGLIYAQPGSVPSTVIQAGKDFDEVFLWLQGEGDGLLPAFFDVRHSTDWNSGGI
jgi:hypothetical protein